MGKYTTLVRGLREKEKRSKALYYYVFKHSIVIDSNVSMSNPHLIDATPLRPYAVDAVAPETQAHARTTYDINDITPLAPLRAGVSELFADPPRWLCRQVAEYRKAPYERMLGPLVQAVRLHIALVRSPDDAPTAALRAGPGTAEIRTEVEREL